MMILVMNNLWHKALLKGTYYNISRTCRLSANVTDISNFKPRDPVLAILKSSPNVTKIMAAVRNNLLVMTPYHMMTALSRLNDINNTYRKKEQYAAIAEDPVFNTLCDNLEKQIETLKVNDIVKVIKLLSNLTVSEDSNILQTLLQRIRQSINLINTEQIITIDQSLSRYEGHTKLVDSLKLALPLAFQIRLPLELTSKNLNQLLYILNYCCYNVLPERCLNNVVTGILLQDPANINAPMAADITKALCKIIDSNYCEGATRIRLIHLCCEIMARDMHQLSDEIILRTVYCLRDGTLNLNPEYYHAEFMDKTAEFAIKNNWDFHKCINLANAFCKIVHSHASFAQYICDKVISNENTLSKTTPFCLFDFINFLSRSNYKPNSEQWNEIQRQMRANPNYDLLKFQLPWTVFFLNMVSLNHYMDEELQIIFSREYLNKNLQRRNNILDCNRLLTLHTAVKTFHNELYELPEYVVSNAKLCHKYNGDVIKGYPRLSLAEPVAKHLALGVGGSDYVIKDVELLDGFIADALVCIKDTCLLKVTSPDTTTTVPISELDVPPGTQIICIVSFKNICYPKNSDHLCSFYRLIVDILEKNGYPAVALNGDKWLSLDDDEKTSYLMEQLKKKCDELGLKVPMFDTLSDILKGYS